MEVNGKVTLQISPEFLCAYEVQIHEIVDAIAAVVTNAQAGLNWLRAQPLDLEEVRRAFNSIAKDGKRAGEIVVQLRALMNEVPHGMEPAILEADRSEIADATLPLAEAATNHASASCSSGAIRPSR